MNKTLFAKVCLLSLLLLCRSYANGASPSTNQSAPRLTIDLRDGSRVVGESLDDGLKFHSVLVGELKLNLRDIRGIECLSATNLVRLTAANGDVLNVRFANKELRVKTTFGKVELPVDTIRKISVTLVTLPGTTPSGLVGWWPGNSNALDIIGGNNGTLLNGASATALGEVSQAFGLNGANQGVEIPYSASLITSNFTVETWIKPLPQARDPINQYLIFGQVYGHCSLVVRRRITGLVVAFQIATSPASFFTVVSTNEIPINQFSHLAGTWDGTTLGLYINGSLNNQITPGVSPVSSGCPFFIGGFYSPGAGSCQYVGQFFNGIIDEVSLFDRALPASEIQTTYQGENGGRIAN